MITKEKLRIEIERAKRELEEAENHFQYADENFRTAAILELAAKREKLNRLFAEAKQIF